MTDDDKKHPLYDERCTCTGVKYTYDDDIPTFEAEMDPECPAHSGLHELALPLAGEGAEVDLVMTEEAFAAYVDGVRAEVKKEAPN